MIKSKKLCAVILAAILLVLTACSGSAAEPSQPTEGASADTITYTVEEMKLTLPYRSNRVEVRGGNWTSGYATEDTTIYVQRIDKSEYEDGIELFDIAKTQQLSQIKYHPSAVKQEDGLIYYDFSAEEQKHEYHYLFVFFESEKSYWLLAFVCSEDIFEDRRPTYFSWINDITFEE